VRESSPSGIENLSTPADALLRKAAMRAPFGSPACASCRSTVRFTETHSRDPLFKPDQAFLDTHPEFRLVRAFKRAAVYRYEPR
jgi:hypothetical protein